jgi:hypothetical protein
MARRRGTSRRSSPPADRAGDRRLSRRRFVALLAAGATAAFATPVLATGTPTKGKSVAKTGAPQMSQKMAKGIEEQKQSTAKTLKTIRSYDLPPGSEQAFAFRPMSPRRRS